MHADLHPGNIMVDAEYRQKRSSMSQREEAALQALQNPSLWSQAHREAISAMNDEMGRLHITMVDAGMVAKLTEEESSAFIGLLSSLGEGDGDEAAGYTLQFSLENNLTEAQRRFFAADMVSLFAERCRGYGTGVDVGEVLRGVLGLIRKHRVRIDGNFATLVINCLCIESMARRVCPNYNVLDAGRPLFQCYRRFKKRLGKNPLKSPLFGVSMSISALKKDIGDRFFFHEEAKRQFRRQQSIVQNIQRV
jgi:aarF domain-containing kinase